MEYCDIYITGTNSTQDDETEFVVPVLNRIKKLTNVFWKSMLKVILPITYAVRCKIEG